LEEWEDGTAVNLDLFCAMIDLVEPHVGPNKTCWIHCYAGLGRTGTMITALILKEHIMQRTITHENLKACITNIIYHLRRQRGPGFVYTYEQFVLLYSYAQKLLNEIGSFAS
jgi:protein tyrosine phosphatase